MTRPRTSAVVHRLPRALVVRPLGAADRAVWLGMRCAMDARRGVAAHDAAIAALAADPGAAAFVCTDRAGAPVGLVEARLRDARNVPTLEVEAIHIGPDADRVASAAALLDALARWGAGRGARAMVFECAAEDETGARLAREQGFERSATVVRWVRDLPAPSAAPPKPAEARVVPAAVPAMRPGHAEPAPPAVAPVVREHPTGGDGGEPPPWRPGPGQLVMFLLGAASFWFSRPWSGDPFFGALLPLFDLCFVIYLIGLVVVVKYRRRTARTLPGLAAAASVVRRSG